MTLGVPVPFAVEHAWHTYPRRFLEAVAVAEAPTRPPHPMPRPFGESCEDIDRRLGRQLIHPALTDRVWPKDDEREAVAKRLRFLLWRLEVTGWRP